jgi:hypothetical protein
MPAQSGERSSRAAAFCSRSRSTFSAATRSSAVRRSALGADLILALHRRCSTLRDGC